MNGEEQKSFGGNAVPPPPPPEIGVRTMQSDLKSIKESGGEAPQPYTINAAGAAPQRPIEEPTPPVPPKINVAGYTGPEQPIFQEPAEPVFAPPEQTSPAGGSGDSGRKSGALKIIIWLIAILAIAGGLGVFGYFVVFPILFPAQPEPIAPEPPPAPESPIQPILPIPEPEEPVLPEPAISEPVIQEPTTTESEIPAIKPHISFFTASSAISQEKIAVDLITPDAFKLTASSTANAMNTGDFKEIVFEKPNGAGFTVADFITAGILPNLLASISAEMSPEAVSQFFEQDFTYFIFKNDQGAWPGYILKANSSADFFTVKSLITALETSADFSKIFIQDPGVVLQPFKDGKAGDLATRYQVYTSKGAALNYGWRDSYLIISASYGGLLETLKKL